MTTRSAVNLRSRQVHTGLTEGRAYPSHDDMNDSSGTEHPGGAAASAAGRLPHLGVLRFAGPDAAVFLQGQVSNDTRRLTEGAPLLAALSTPQGRVTAVLHLLPHSSGLIAVLPRELVVPVAERLRKYVLRAKVQIEDLSGEFEVRGRHGIGAPRASGPGASAPGALAHVQDARGYAEQGGIGVARVAAGDPGRYWAIGRERDFAALEVESGSNAPAGDAWGADARGAHAPGADAPGAAEAAWRLADIRAGMPQIYAATRDTFVAQMLNLDLIEGISFTKGCFTGQEIIARTQHLGRIKRRLHRLRLPAGSWSIGQAIHLPDGRVGRLTEVAAVGAEFEALAVLTLQTSAAASASGAGAGAGVEEITEGGAVSSTPVDAVILPLPYALGVPGTPP
jgi:folate-binding protein YgfZ